MKKIFVLTTLIAGILITMACGNSIAPKEQVVAEFVKKDSLQFTPEEIAYNDSVKDIPMDYIVLREKEYGMGDDFDSLNPKRNEMELMNVTQEQAYLEAYKQFCEDVIITTKMFIQPEKSKYSFTKIYVELLDKEWNNVIPWVDFPDKMEKEMKIWNKLLIENVSASEQSQYKCPIISKGKEMYAEFWLNDSIKFENQSKYEKGFIVPAIYNEKNEYPFTKKEIDQNNSIKNTPVDYVIYEKSEYILKENPNKIENATSITEMKGITQEEAYLKACKEFCENIEYYSFMFGYGNSQNQYLYLRKSIKLYSKDNPSFDIIPLIDFSYRRRKEKEVWNKVIKDGILPTTRRHLIQPIVNKDEVMHVEFKSPTGSSL